MSSSGHLALVPRLLGWDCAELPGDVRKTFDVALHAGSAPALLVALRSVGLGRPDALALTLLPPAILGLAFEDAIEQRLGTVESVATAQLVAGAALLGADLWAEARGRSGAAGGRAKRAGPSGAQREAPDALDHLLVGLAQAAALVPGVSRSGAALTAARLRRLSRHASMHLSLRAALPVTVAAGALKAARMVGDARRDEARGRRACGDAGGGDMRAALAVGATAALGSALASLPLLRLVERRGGLRALACYRMGLGVAALLLNRRNRASVGPVSRHMGG